MLQSHIYHISLCWCLSPEVWKIVFVLAVTVSLGEILIVCFCSWPLLNDFVLIRVGICISSFPGLSALFYVWALTSYSCAPIRVGTIKASSCRKSSCFLLSLTYMLATHHSSEAILTHPSWAYRHQHPWCSTNDCIIRLQLSRRGAHFLSFGPRHGEKSVLIMVSAELAAGYQGREKEPGLQLVNRPVISCRWDTAELFRSFFYKSDIMCVFFFLAATKHIHIQLDNVC